MDRKGQKYQVNTFRRKQRPAPFHQKGRGRFISSRKIFGTNFRKRK